MEKAIKQMHVAEGELASSVPSLTPEGLGICNGGNESSSSRTSPVPDPCFGMVPEQHKATPPLAPPRLQTKLPLAYVRTQLSLCPPMLCSSAGHAGVDTGSPRATIPSRGREVWAAGTP